jgi:hypothetical protein
MNQVPPLPRLLGIAGLLPQLACLLVLWFGPAEWRYVALAAAWGYAALIFSFLGGLWWGIAAARSASGGAAPAWLWAAAVIPSLVAFATYLPWIIGWRWPAPSLAVLGLGLVASLLVDRRLGALVPIWWMALRRPLSVGLGTVTLLIALAAWSS